MTRGKKMILRAIGILCAAGAAVSIWELCSEVRPRVEAEGFYAKMREQVFPAGAQTGPKEGAAKSRPDRGAPDWKVLEAWNPDICGWIYSPGTAIDYPIVQGADNDWYLNHTVDQKKSMIGSIFLDSRNQADFSDDVSVIYGHHIRGGRMFTPISGYKDQRYYEEHPVMYLYTPEADYRIELFADEILDGGTGSFPFRFVDEKAREDWLEQLQADGAFRKAPKPAPEERILALCTCTYEYQDARYTVYGIMKKLEIEENENDEGRTQDERNSENNSVNAVLPDAASDSGYDGACRG